MNAVLDMLARRNPRTRVEYEYSLKQIIQEIALLGLWRGKFFEKAAFYGGSALRIFYGLDRFSEDLDFSLLKRLDEFKLADYFPFIVRELEGFGFDVEVIMKEKSASGDVDTAFVKANTLIHFIKVGVPADIRDSVQANRLLKVKFEIDNDPPPGFEVESRFALEPIPFSVVLYTPPSLFAGKMHALLFRSWKSRVKGRDWYDFYWFVKKGVLLDLFHLGKRMEQSGHLESGKTLSREVFERLLSDRIGSIDFSMAKRDVAPFLHDVREIEVWSAEFFLDVLRRVRFKD